MTTSMLARSTVARSRPRWFVRIRCRHRASGWTSAIRTDADLTAAWPRQPVAAGGLGPEQGGREHRGRPGGQTPWSAGWAGVAHEGDVIKVAAGAGAADPGLADAVNFSLVFVVHSKPVVLGSGRWFRSA
jgi:hypothetical protein